MAKADTMLVDDEGKPLSEKGPKSPPTRLHAVTDDRLKDDNGKPLSEADPKDPPARYKRRVRDLYKKYED